MPRHFQTKNNIRFRHRLHRRWIAPGCQPHLNTRHQARPNLGNPRVGDVPIPVNIEGILDYPISERATGAFEIAAVLPDRIDATESVITELGANCLCGLRGQSDKPTAIPQGGITGRFLVLDDFEIMSACFDKWCEWLCPMACRTWLVKWWSGRHADGCAEEVKRGDERKDIGGVGRRAVGA
jgi:hypothetical protein